MSRVRTVSSCSIATLMVTREILGLRSFDEEHIRVVTGILCSTNEDISHFLLFAHTGCNSGRFALSFNSDLREALNSGDLLLLEKLSTCGREGFPELFDNPLLTEREYLSVLNMYNRELKTIQHLLKTGTLSVTPSELKYMKSLYLKCYQEVCMKEVGYEDILVSHDIPQFVMILDQNNPCTLQLVPLLFSLANNSDYGARAVRSTLNPCTDSLFGQREESLLRSRYAKEIKMILRYTKSALLPA